MRLSFYKKGVFVRNYSNLFSCMYADMMSTYHTVCLSCPKIGECLGLEGNTKQF